MKEPPLPVLLAESNPVVRQAIVSQLQHLGHSAQLANSAAELRAMVDRANFAFLLIDAAIVEDAEYLRALRRRIPTIGLLSELDPASAGIEFRAVLVRPFSCQRLAEALASIRTGIGETEPLIQKEELLARLGGNRQLLPQMLDMLRKQAEVWREEMRATITLRDGEALARFAHQAKGALANFAAAQPAAAAKELEESARAGQWERADEGVSGLVLLIDRMIQELAAM
jgi:HPt (histidine-containing phosphotransfer) domain-containing protein/CheY-like chemotaxis protein